MKSMLWSKPLIGLVCAATIVSCGGGGGGGGGENSAPEAQSVMLVDINAGSLVVGDTLELNYVFADADGDAEGDTSFAWFRDNQLIDGAESDTYLVQAADLGRSITATVLPRASSGELVGAAVTSAPLVVGSGANIPPIADAGEDVNTGIGVNVVLSGAASNDPDGEIRSYTWTSSIWSTPRSETEVSVSFAQPGTYTFTLRVRDDRGASSTDEVIVHVTAPDNQAPIANAGEDIQITVGQTAQFDGSGSSDPDGSIVSYSWASGLLTGVSPTLVYNTVGEYSVQLIVTDDDGATASDTVLVSVLPLPNQLPVANAGADIAVNAGATVTFNGAASTDADGSIATYAWRWEGLETPLSGVSPSHVFSQAGSYTVTLTVTDNAGASATDTLVVEVNALPVATIQASATAVLVGTSVTLDGSASSDSDGTIANYQWDSPSWESPLSGDALIEVNFATPGNHTIILTVTDNLGASASDEVVIVVSNPPNQAPIASVGEPKQRTVATGAPLALSGSASSDPENGELSYQWTAEAWEQALNGVNQEVSFAEAGTYVITLTVTDEGGLSASDTLTVVVEDEAPVVDAEAGADQTVSLGDTVALDGTASTVSGADSVSYTWTSPAFEGSLNGASTSFVANAPGSFAVTLTVTAGDVSDSDTFTLTVNELENQAPIANAGADIEVELGNPVTFDGSGSSDAEDGNVQSYTWTSSAWTEPLSGVAPTFTFSAAGSYEVTLTVSDSDMATATDTVTVVVREPVGNRPPVAEAGELITVVMGEDFTLDASASSDPDEGDSIVSYRWSNRYWEEEIAGVSATRSFDYVGRYTIDLVVTDSEGATGADSVVVNVVQPEGAAWMAGDADAIWNLYPGVTKAGDVWTVIFHAPEGAENVRIYGDFTAGETPEEALDNGVALIPTPDGKFWWLQAVDEAFLSAPTHGASYRFAFDIEETAGVQVDLVTRTVQDPAARWVTSSDVVNGWSRVMLSDSYTWQSTDWERPEWNSYNIYQLHPSRFTNRNGAVNAFAEVAEELNNSGSNDYINNLGVSAIQLLPVYEFTGDYSWGYNPSFFFAVESAYGGPDALKALVDEAHQNGISVILDVVLNHMSTTDNILWVVDSETYADGDTYWGAMPNFDNDVAKHFMIKHVVYLMEEFKIDAIRFDSTHTVHQGNRVSDTVRVAGSGGGWELLNELRAEMKAIDSGVLMIAEEFPFNPGLVQEAQNGQPHGPMDSQWNGSFHYPFTEYLKGSRQPSALWDNGSFGNFGDSWQDSLLYVESHDSAGAQGCTGCRFTNFSATAGWQMTQVAMAGNQLARGIPMNFMGFEAGEWLKFDIEEGEAVLDVDGYEDEDNAARQKLLNWFRRMNEIRALDPQALAQGDSQLLHAENSTGVVAFQRDGGRYLIVMNRSGNTYWNYSLGFTNQRYRELANSSWPAYNIGGVTEATRGGDSAESISNVHIPAYGAVVLVRE